MANRSTTALAELFITDVTDEADGMAIHSGAMNVADRTILDAVAIAHRETGAPTITCCGAQPHW